MDNSNDQMRENNIQPSKKNETTHYSSYSVSENVNHENSKYYDDNYNTATIDVQPVTHKKKKGFSKKAASYIAFGLTCSILGGVVSGIATLYVIPKTSLFSSTPLYESLYKTTASNIAAASATTATTTTTTTSSNSTTTSSSGLTVSQIAKKVGPAVVGISTKISSSSDSYSGKQTEEGYGSGIIFSSDGYILTNYHVIEGANSISVTFNNKKKLQLKL